MKSHLSKKPTFTLIFLNNGLKVLSSEMDLAEISFIRKAFIYERGAEEVFRKIHLSPIL
jgi:hypothetical protein